MNDPRQLYKFLHWIFDNPKVLFLIFILQF